METDSRTVPGMKCEQCWGTPGGEGHCRWARKVRSPPEQGGSASRQEGTLLWRGDLLPPFRSGRACRLRGWPCLQDILPTLQPLHGTYSAGDKQSHSEPPLRKPDRGATGHQAQPPRVRMVGRGVDPPPLHPAGGRKWFPPPTPSLWLAWDRILVIRDWLPRAGPLSICRSAGGPATPGPTEREGAGEGGEPETNRETDRPGQEPRPVAAQGGDAESRAKPLALGHLAEAGRARTYTQIQRGQENGYLG
ncbi:voltage-gated hydrogen channel 1 isoform X6 [Mustela lutreola]|uniref:voltage-gated hydrogen channel 1 isoform X6 n=1 Tax=Mustela lutreola TaxID=9666 RepID=UPI002797B067|nr:voltage-gated hydrogen channel 1 isoform X6 [Mustela lutreola]